MSSVVEALVAIGTGVVALAALAVLVSKNAQTPQVFSAAGQSFSGVLNAATGPVSGAPSAPSWPTSPFGSASPFGG